MPSVKLDRENRGKVNAVRRVPTSSSDKGNVCMHENTGHFYTRRVSSGSLQDFFNICSDITYVSNAIELTTLLLDDTPRILTLGAKSYEMPSGGLNITAPKVVIGKSPEDSILKFTWDPGRSLRDLYFNSNNIHFYSIGLQRTQDSTPSYFIEFSGADNSGLHNCRIGYGATDPGNYLIRISNSDYVSIEDCFLDIASSAKGSKRLVYGSNSNHLELSRCVGEDQIVHESVKLDSCDHFSIRRCSFTNSDSVDSNPGITLSRSNYGEVSTTYVKVNSFSGISSTYALRTAESSLTYCSNVRIHDCSFLLHQDGDYSAADSFAVALWGDYLSLTDSYIRAANMGNSEDAYSLPGKAVVGLLGNGISVRGNDIYADGSRCAVLVDANEADCLGNNSFGTRIADNYIHGFGHSSSDFNPAGLDRADGYGIYLTDLVSVAGSSLPCSYGVITGNTIAGDTALHSTAITGCPVNYFNDSVSAAYWAIGNNLIWCDPPSGATQFGIKTLNIEYSSMLGNIGTNAGVKSVLDHSCGTNDTNEYGTTNDDEATGANI